MFAMTKVNPDLMQLMWTTLPGIICLVGVVLLDAIGYLWVLKIANVEY
jgi:Flp pilus assembly protein TadB